VADNDLAFGQIVEALSRTAFWKDTCVFAIEDDPQAGYDHVSSYRTTAYVASPYSRGRGVIHNEYNQTSLLKTMELILGLPPMNRFDASADAMSACFGAMSDLTPFTAAPNRVPLDKMNPEPRKIGSLELRKDAIVSAAFNLAEPDRCPEDTLNRILWRAQKGVNALYPSWAITHISRSEDDD
jgi:hypothetical protein